MEDKSVIIYFSATGNSKYVASKVAEATNDYINSITDIIGNISLQQGERLGIVIPTYFYWVPSIVKTFLENVEIDCSENTYIYCIATCGGTSGQASQMVGKLLEKKGKRVNAYFDIVMPDNWTPMFDANNTDEIAKVIKKEKPQIEKIVGHIQRKESGKFAKHTLPFVIAKLISLFYEPSRKTSHLHVENQCIGCGKCMSDCPVKAIEIQDGKPVWVKDKCTMCLGCLHKCPTFAIQYGKNTKKHGQYNHPESNINGGK